MLQNKVEHIQFVFMFNIVTCIARDAGHGIALGKKFLLHNCSVFLPASIRSIPQGLHFALLLLLLLAWSLSSNLPVFRPTVDQT
jgi:hypothetical protein